MMSDQDFPVYGADSGPEDAAPEGTAPFGNVAQNLYAHMALRPADLDIDSPGNGAGAQNLYARMALHPADLDSRCPGNSSSSGSFAQGEGSKHSLHHDAFAWAHRNDLREESHHEAVAWAHKNDL